MPNVLEGRCDICWRKDDDEELRMTKCRDCGVCFHTACYGLHNLTNEEIKSPKGIQCFACEAIGKTIHVREKCDSGIRLALKVTERPTECCLCSVDDKDEFLHAMHPIYDDHGLAGRQICLPPSVDKPQRLAWAHTLCCLVIASQPGTGGCLYGCSRDGEYGQAEDDVDSSDEGSKNSQLTKSATEDAIHHFVYITKHRRGYAAYHKNLKDSQELTCCVCKKDDTLKSSYRIPLNCCKNEDHEYKRFKGSYANDGNCVAALHVGCALWGRDEKGALPNNRRVYFFPGKSDNTAQDSEPIANIFCTNHADDHLRKEVGAKRLYHPQGTRKARVRAAAVSIQTPEKRRRKVQNLLKRVTGEEDYPKAKLDVLDIEDKEERPRKRLRKFKR